MTGRDVILCNVPDSPGRSEGDNSVPDENRHCCHLANFQ